MTLTREQQCVFDWLNDKLQLPVFAEGYRGALQSLHEQSPGYITFVAHAGRDLMNTLARTVSGINSGRVQYEQLLDELQNEWKEEWGASGFNKLNNTENGYLIPYDTCQKVKHLIDEHDKGRSRNAEADDLFFATFLDYKDKERIPTNFLSDWKAAKKWFQKHTHLRKDDFSSDTASEVVRHFKRLDELLYVAASSEYERIRGINEILEETNQ